MMNTNKKLNDERTRRLNLWGQYKSMTEKDPSLIDWEFLKSSRIYRGQAGIWRDLKQMTRQLTDDEFGIAVAIMPKDTHYENYWDDNVLVYKYPSTNRSTNVDTGEIKSLQHAMDCRLPVFVVSQKQSHWHVQLGWVVACDEFAKCANINFIGQDDSSLAEIIDKSRFQLTTTGNRPRMVNAKIRSRDPNFGFAIRQQYKGRCALTGNAIYEVLEAAHICGVAYNGSSHVGNGLLLCANAHKAFDAHLFAIDPETLKITDRTNGATLRELQIDAEALIHIRDCGGDVPHKDALAWRWKKTHEKWDKQ
jgi:HNH endonuclease